MVFSHLPYISTRIRSDNDKAWAFTENKKRGMIEYPLTTQPGISGGAVVVNGFVVGKKIASNGMIYFSGTYFHILWGIHNANNENHDGHGWGTAFTMELKEWIGSKYSEWTSIMGVAAAPKSSIKLTKVTLYHRSKFFAIVNLTSGQFKSGGGTPSPIDNQNYQSFTNRGRRSPPALKLTRC